MLHALKPKMLYQFLERSVAYGAHERTTASEKDKKETIDTRLTIQRLLVEQRFSFRATTDAENRTKVSKGTEKDGS